MEYQILNHSDTVYDDGTFRLDAEHYQKCYLDNQEKLKNFGASSLINHIAMPVMTGHTPSMKNESYYGGEIRFVKTNNLREFIISGQFNHYLSESGNAVIQRSSLKAGDLIVTIIGATHKIVGRAALVRSEDTPANINQNIALIRLKKAVSPEFLSAYLNSKFGKYNLWYLSRQTEQVNLNCREIEKVLVPDIKPELVVSIESSYKKAVELEHNAKSRFEDTVNLLLSELDLSNWQPKHQLSFIKNCSDTNQAGRIDAEYYQPKYDEMISIASRRVSLAPVKELFSFRRGEFIAKDYYTDEKTTHAYIRIKELAKAGFLDESQIIYLNDNFEANMSNNLQEFDLVMAIIGDTIGKTNLITKEYEGSYCSNNTGRFRLKPHLKDKFLPNYLEVLFQSQFIQQQVQKAKAQTAQPKISDNEINKILIPNCPIEKQQQIQQQITESFNLRKQSKHLLVCAKRAVEMAIEQDEQTAMNWLKNETKEEVKQETLWVK